MKTTKFVEELRALSAEELNAKLKELKEELFRLRFQHAINQLDNPQKIVEVKKNIAAKTGTAQVTSIDLENNAWFVCFAPRETPEIAIVVFVPHGYSGGMASIGARDFVQWYLDNTEKRTTDVILPVGNSLAP